MRRPYFSKVTFDPSFGIPCKIQYADVGADLYATRTVEVGFNGEFSYSDLDRPNGECGAILPEKEFPNPDNLPNEIGKFVSVEVTELEFEAIWAKVQGS